MTWNSRDSWTGPTCLTKGTAEKTDPERIHPSAMLSTLLPRNAGYEYGLTITDLTENYKTWLGNMPAEAGNPICVLVLHAAESEKDGGMRRQGMPWTRTGFDGQNGQGKTKACVSDSMPKRGKNFLLPLEHPEE